MTKVVFNDCYGIFGLSKDACRRYWELQGKEVWIEDGDFSGSFTVWLVPPEERVKQPKNGHSMTMDECREYDKKYSKQTWYDRYVDRHDPILVQVVEELGAKANGMFASLAIDEIQGPYRIDEYGGSESVETCGSYDWITP